MNIFINESEGRLRAGWRLLLQFLFMVIILFLGAAGFSFVLPGSLMLSMAIPFFIAVIASVWIAARYFDNRPFEEYGIRFNGQWWKEYMVGVVIAAVAVCGMFLIEWWAGWITITGYGWNASTDVSFGLGITSFFLAMVMVGFHEELFSRGYQVLNLTEGLRYPQIGERGAIVIAVVLTSSLFGTLHIFNANASAISTFNVTLAGVVLAVPYVVTGRLALSAGLHFSWNFVMAGVMGFPVSGNVVAVTVLQIKQGGVDLWTGGAFGPEAGIVGWIGMTIMLGGTCVYIKAVGHELTIAEKFRKEYQSALKSDEQTP